MLWTVDWRPFSQRLQGLVPVTLLGLLALITYWLAQNSPILSDAGAERRDSGKPDAYFHQFRMVSFDHQGQWLMQISGDHARHTDQKDMYDIEEPRMLKRAKAGDPPMRLSASRARASDEGQQLELFGQALIEQEAYVDERGQKREGREIRSEYLLLDDHRQALETHLPVTLSRGADVFSAERLQALQKENRVQLEGRVRGVLMPRPAPQPKMTQ